MKWVEIMVTTAPQAVEAIANILLECKTGGVQEDHAASGLVQLRAYLPVGPATDVTLDAIARRVRSLPQFGLDVGPGRVTTAFLEDASWAHAWKNHFKPFRVGRRFWITPTWDDTPPPAGAVVIALDPGMAFGSGLHPSTQLCLRVLEDRLWGGKRVFDVGTGSGILAISAAKCGAGSVLAIDVDPVAVAVARGNAAYNQVADRVEVRAGNLLHGVDGQADLVTANLTADIHFDFLPTAPEHLSPGGTLVASGIAAERVMEVQAVARASGLAPQEVRRDGEWCCLILGSESAPGSRLPAPVS